jgi:hypothetical protein
MHITKLKTEGDAATMNEKVAEYQGHRKEVKASDRKLSSKHTQNQLLAVMQFIITIKTPQLQLKN